MLGSLVPRVYSATRYPRLELLHTSLYLAVPDSCRQTTGSAGLLVIVIRETARNGRFCPLAHSTFPVL